MQERNIWTIGHSTRDLGKFIAMLRSFQIELVVDIRSFPGSRRYPHFNKEALAISLPKTGIDYIHLPDLGGRRKPLNDSNNTGWRLAAFRGYADYMETDAFEKGIKNLELLASKKRVAYMCSEAVWWRCHRSLIADALLVHGLRVEEITSGTRRQIHVLTRFAKVSGLVITYPPETSSPDFPVMDVDVDGTNAPLARVAHRATVRPIN